ncbi:uncharacterized protein LOC110460779 isoform X4 [Mizuhopecten yessoensis]|uniref:uncharacterized protein LOC110460779 isoform X4 n=1 Tax=Mizuhopecten yessoensis TaxID=6573 RepID=UPI000B459E39|nr:uncharacterized protein LOC110460779 isoform X4 [Mizuhopecten yessoensis]
MLDLSKIKEDFSFMVKEAQPWTLTQFVMWLDLKLSEYKIKGYMVLDHEKTTKPRWLSPDDDNDAAGDIAPQPPNCPKCNTNNQGQTRADNSNQLPQRRNQNTFQRQQQRNRNTHFRRQGNESYINEVLCVGDNVQNSRTSIDPSARGSNKDMMPQVISLEPATDLTAEDIKEMDKVFQSKDSSNVDDDVVEISHPASRGIQRHRRPQVSSTVTSKQDIGRGFITAGSTVGSSFLQEGHDQESFSRPPREESPPKRQVAMVDLSRASVPEEEPSYDPPPTSIRPELLMSARNEPTQNMSHNQTGPGSGLSDQPISMSLPVPVALHVARPSDPGGSTPMETSSSVDPSATEIKQEVNDSFEECFLTGTDEQNSQMYMMGDNSLSDSEASFNQGQAYSPQQNPGTSGMTPMGFGQGLYTVGEQEVDLPKFEDPLVRRVLEDGAAPSRHMWSKIITRCAYHMLSKGVPHKHDYQLFSKAFYLRYPCIGTNRGPNPWSVFSKTLSQKVRNIRWQKRKGYTFTDKQSAFEGMSVNVAELDSLLNSVQTD